MRNLRFWTLVMLALLALPALWGQSKGQEMKDEGLRLMGRGVMDSAMVLLDQAVLLGVSDGEVLGAQALLYLEQGDAQRALEKAVDARKDQQRPSPDAWVAGTLAHAELGNVSQRDRWLEQGLEAFPGDYRLLYHAGRFAIPFDPENGQRYLLRAIYAYPAFGEAHLLLGEQMYRRGENLKAALPMLYYLTMFHDEAHSADLVAALERLYDSWSANQESISKFSRASSGFKADFLPQAFSGTRDEKGDWFVAQTMDLMAHMSQVEVNSEDALWVFYSDFFEQIHHLEFAEALAHHIAYSRYPDLSMLWINDNPREYEMLGDWMLLQ